MGSDTQEIRRIWSGLKSGVVKNIKHIHKHGSLHFGIKKQLALLLNQVSKHSIFIS